MAANLPTGTKVTTPEGATGVTVNAPVLTATGYVVSVKFDAAFAHLSPVGGADYSVDALTVTPAGRTLRPSQGESVLGTGWELLYNKPRANAQVVRNGQGAYALACTKHLTVHRLARLTDEGPTRKAGGWCPDCSR